MTARAVAPATARPSDCATGPSRARYCVIGAGAAGLATVRELRERGVDFDCFEATDRVGGHWHTDYECLHLITSRDLSAFEGFPMPASYPHFPSREQIVDYLASYAEAYGLGESITFETEVESLTPIGADGSRGWSVATSDGLVRSYQGVIVCNGHLWDPNIPSLPGQFSGPIYHSANYRNLTDVVGERVLVVGAGNSGCDIAVELAHARKQVFVSMRSGQLFQPKTIFGRPRSELALAKLPPRLNELALYALMRMMHGPASSYGMPDPNSRWLRNGRAVVNSQLLHWVHHGRVTIVPGISQLYGDGVHLEDRTAHEVDTIILATGFKVSFPFLDSGLLQWREGAPLRHAATTVPLGLDRLFFVGMAEPRGAQFPTYNVSARLVADMLRLREESEVRFDQMFGRQERPEWRVDVMRHEWLHQVRRAERILRSLKSAPTSSRVYSLIH